MAEKRFTRFNKNHYRKGKEPGKRTFQFHAENMKFHTKSDSFDVILGPLQMGEKLLGYQREASRLATQTAPSIERANIFFKKKTEF